MGHTDFRGINITSVIERYFEKTVYKQFGKNVFQSNLSASQYACRGRCSCTDALIKIQDTYLHALDERDCAGVRMFTMDYSKALDNVNHELLSRKIKLLDLKPFLKNWYFSFLKDRK